MKLENKLYDYKYSLQIFEINSFELKRAKYLNLINFYLLFKKIILY